MRRSRMKKKKVRVYKYKKDKIFDLILFILLILGSFIVLFPILWMIMTALKTTQEVAKFPAVLFPEKFHWENFAIAWSKAPFTRYTLNSLLLVVINMVGAVLSNSIIAYAFAKMKFPGRELFFNIILATMMIPGFVLLIPQYVIFSKLHWVGSYLPLTVPAYLGNAFHIFMMRQFYKTIPGELSEAAKIDGAGHFYIYSRVMLPLIKPILATITLVTFKGTWSDFQGPLLYLSDKAKYTLQLGLNVFKGQGFTDWNYLMAVSFLSMIPILILFFCFQDYFIQGMNISGADK